MVIAGRSRQQRQMSTTRSESAPTWCRTPIGALAPVFANIRSAVGNCQRICRVPHEYVLIPRTQSVEEGVGASRGISGCWPPGYGCQRVWDPRLRPKYRTCDSRARSAPGSRTCVAARPRPHRCRRKDSADESASGNRQRLVLARGPADRRAAAVTSSRSHPGRLSTTRATFGGTSNRSTHARMRRTPTRPTSRAAPRGPRGRLSTPRRGGRSPFRVRRAVPRRPRLPR
jgi:hypothetical protein